MAWISRSGRLTSIERDVAFIKEWLRRCELKPAPSARMTKDKGGDRTPMGLGLMSLLKEIMEDRTLPAMERIEAAKAYAALRSPSCAGVSGDRNPEARCGDCLYWQEERSYVPADVPVTGKHTAVGQCRIRSVQDFPRRWADQWCGEFRRKGKTAAPEYSFDTISEWRDFLDRVKEETEKELSQMAKDPKYSYDPMRLW